MSCIIPIQGDYEGFGLQNLPFGIFSDIKTGIKRAATAIGPYVIDLHYLALNNVFAGTPLDSCPNVFGKDSLNSFMELGHECWIAVRKCIQKAFTLGDEKCLGDIVNLEKMGAIYPNSLVKLHLPITIGDYTDFYSSRNHAENVGTMFRGKENALQPNWLRIPIGYHGRSSSIMVSGEPITRPKGQLKTPDLEPVVGLTKKLDFELEVAFVVGKGNDLGSSISVEDADKHIFGLMLMNDWSARDIQAWEYVPLGPFLGKSFGTIVSPWIITLKALEPFIIEGPIQDDPYPCPYLQDLSPGCYDVELKVKIQEEDLSKEASTVCTSNLKYMYWNFRQQLAHHTINGCNMRSGDLCGSGTISGETQESFGSMLELSWNGKNDVILTSTGSTRKFIEDTDIVIITGMAKRNGFESVSFGECICPILAGHL